jgi:hypothetical protein
VGVGVLGSVSMPIGSTDDSMVKVASETVSSPKFYDRFFTLVEIFLPPEVKKAAHIPEKPKTDLGIPEPVAQAPKPAALVETKPATPEAVPAKETAPEAAPAPSGSEPAPAPAEQQSIQVEPVTPAPPVETTP